MKFGSIILTVSLALIALSVAVVASNPMTVCFGETTEVEKVESNVSGHYLLGFVKTLAFLIFSYFFGILPAIFAWYKVFP